MFWFECAEGCDRSGVFERIGGELVLEKIYVEEGESEEALEAIMGSMG